jgi:hypothetical protein
MNKLLIASLVLFGSIQISHADERDVYDGYYITQVGMGAISDVGKEAYISHSKQIPLKCEGVEDQLILKGYVGSRYTRRWVYEVVGSDTYHATPKVGQSGCVLQSTNADQLRKELQEELDHKGRNTMIGVVIFFGVLGLFGLYQERKDR